MGRETGHVAILKIEALGKKGDLIIRPLQVARLQTVIYSRYSCRLGLSEAKEASTAYEPNHSRAIDADSVM